jgi:hypothetical protein
MQELEQALALARLEFLRELQKAGVEFEVSAIDGFIILNPTETLEFLENPDAVLAKRAGVGLEEWQRWKNYVYDGHQEPFHTISLHEFLTKPPKTANISRDSIPSDLRWEVWERDNFTCQQCGSRRHLTIDHIIPISKGGQTVKENLQTLCSSCNSKKGCNG